VRQVGERAELALELVDLLDVGVGDGLERDLLARSTSSASYTTPMPPAPIRRTTW
jgi:hypothetical protein